MYEKKNNAEFYNFRAKSLRTASNMFVVNLAFCDFMMMLKAPIFIYNSFYRGFALGQLGCQIFAFMGSLSGIGAGMTNAFIAYDRYTTITKPFDGKLTRTKAFVFILIIWLYTIPWAVMPLTEVWGRFGPGKDTGYSQNKFIRNQKSITYLGNF